MVGVPAGVVVGLSVAVLLIVQVGLLVAVRLGVLVGVTVAVALGVVVGLLVGLLVRVFVITGVAVKGTGVAVAWAEVGLLLLEQLVTRVIARTGGMSRKKNFLFKVGSLI